MLGFALRLVPHLAMWGLRRFYRVDTAGSPIPDGPALIIANHPNSLIDALVIMQIAGRRVCPLAKAGLFTHPMLGPVLKGLSALPVYRVQDFPTEMERNEGTFSAAIDALLGGGAVLIFPEGLTHSEPRLAPMKTGAARIALRAEEEAGWELGLKVVPVGLTYHRKHAFRGRVAAEVGRHLSVLEWRDERERDERNAVESLTAALGDSLARVTLNFATHEERALIEAAESLYAVEKRLSRPRDRTRLIVRLPRLRRFADAVAWLHETDPASYQQLAASVQTYRSRLSLLGVSEGELPARFPASAVLRYVLVQGFALTVALPLAVVGTVAWYLPYKSPRISLGYYRPDFEAVATMKLATALLAFPATFAVWLAAAWWIAGVKGLVAAALLLPITGIVAMHWRDRWIAVREDARLFWRAARRKTLREQLVARRVALVEQFDELARNWQAERRRLRGSRGEPSS